MTKYIREITRIFGLSAVLLSGAACKGPFNTKLFKERAAEEPPPHEEAVDKSFFVNADGRPKTFLCAWAPEMGRGWIGERWNTILVNESPHCNVEFEIKEDSLIGKRIHPSYPNDRNRWEEIIRIPIKKHFYYEREKDQHGRETNRWIENDSRSHWSARPKFRLNLQNVSLDGLSDNIFRKESSAYEIEWDHKRNFLGFSLDIAAMYFTSNQMKIRVNFLEFKHDPTFKKTPFHQENSRFMNILHVMGRRVEGIEPELYAAHWDLRQTNTIYLNGVPKEHEKTVIGAVEKWNEAFRKIGAIGPNAKAFKAEIANLKHPFDLRYPTFNWISDVRLSQWSPLGIGMAHADVRNGKILWGSVNLYGGMLENYINRYTPISSAGANGHGGQATLTAELNPIRVMGEMFTKSFAPIKRLDQLTVASRPALAQSLISQARLQQQVFPTQLKDLPPNHPAVESMISTLTDKAQEQTALVQDYFKQTPLIQHFGSSLLRKTLTESVSQDPAKQYPRAAQIAKLKAETDPVRRQRLIQDLAIQNSSFTVEEELNIANMAPAWSNSPARQKRTFPQLLESVVMDLSLHELGHFLGLGHQFKENILPEDGTVPSHYIKELAPKATAEGEFINYTSVMGYRSGRTEMITTADDMKPGPHDELVIRYLYRSEYAAYNPKVKDEFIFGPVPANGKIPSISQHTSHPGELFKTAYFPQCNDMEASLGADPFCNRWDRGATAQDLVKGYFEHINDNLLTNLYSLVNGGGDAESAEAGLWWSALDTMARVRLFYDEMRRRLRSDADLKPLWNQLRSDKAALLGFSQACQMDDHHSDKVAPVVQKILDRADIKDLCRANLIALNEFRFYLNLPNSDYSRIDHKSKYVSGGYLEGDVRRNWGHMFGSWYQLSNLPLKISALHTLSTARPYMLWGGLIPNFYYDHEENRFLYRTLFPREYTKLISEGIQHNMRFEATGHADTTGIGRTILAAGSMLPWMRYTSNDSARLPKDYTDLLDQQTEFQYSAVAVLIKPTKPDANSNVKADHYKKFTAQIFDFFSGRTINARDVYILPNGNVLVWANGSFIYPITELKFYQGNEAYVIAYKISYGYKPGDELVEDSVKAGLLEKHNAVLAMCVDGFNGNGLGNYFQSSNSNFEGFLIPPGIAEEAGNEKMDLFYKSVDAAFAKYDNSVATDKSKSIPADFPIKSMRQLCDKAVRGVGQIVSSAALINGFWLGITADYLEK